MKYEIAEAMKITEESDEKIEYWKSKIGKIKDGIVNREIINFYQKVKQNTTQKGRSRHCRNKEGELIKELT